MRLTLASNPVSTTGLNKQDTKSETCHLTTYLHMLARLDRWSDDMNKGNRKSVADCDSLRMWRIRCHARWAGRILLHLLLGVLWSECCWWLPWSMERSQNRKAIQSMTDKRVLSIREWPQEQVHRWLQYTLFVSYLVNIQKRKNGLNNQ